MPCWQFFNVIMRLFSSFPSSKLETLEDRIVSLEFLDCFGISKKKKERKKYFFGIIDSFLILLNLNIEKVFEI